MSTAFDPVELAGRRLRNRIAMSPMTRSRAYGPGATPNSSTALYYAQRASAGLVITEGTQPSVIGQGYPNTPGLHREAQVRAWRTVTDAVHERGGTIAAQLMHTGRVGHPSLLPDGLRPVAPSAVAAAGQTFTADGPQDMVTPSALTAKGIADTIADFVAAARNAVAAGFDAVELHGANGYLLHQFLSTNANRRDDEWGGSVAGRLRMPLQTVRAVAAAIGPERTAIRLSPGNPLGDIVEDDIDATYTTLVDALRPIGLGYLHLLEGPDRALTHTLRRRFGGPLVLNPYTPGRTTDRTDLHLIEDGTTDLLSFGALFLANPDLPARLAAGGPFNEPDRATFYGGDDHGYTDYPTLDRAAA